MNSKSVIEAITLEFDLGYQVFMFDSFMHGSHFPFFTYRQNSFDIERYCVKLCKAVSSVDATLYIEMKVELGKLWRKL